MYRKIQHEFLIWKNKKKRLPILLRGARQVGKTYLIEQLGKEHFESFLSVNFELDPRQIRAFDSLIPSEIIGRLELLNRTRIIPGKTLLFLDEIQACPQAIVALRYFKEKMPDLHVIGAGSLLEFVLHEEQFSFPVGRILPMHLRPMSFEEFLQNIGEEQSLEKIRKVSLKSPPEAFLHEHLMRLVRQYFLLGGMPATISSFLEQQSWVECKRVQGALLQTYRSDFGKYAKKSQHATLEKVFERAPGLIGKGVKYVFIDPDMRSRELKVAIQQLGWAGLLTKICATSGSGLPLQTQVKENQFKLLFLDIGLLQNANQVNPDSIFEQDLIQINQGALAEQFVGQELLAYADCYEDFKLYFWQREEKNSTAEVDYLAVIDSKIVPIEVKAGKTGRLKSIKQFMQEKKISLGVKVSAEPLGLDREILSIPFYLISQLERLFLYAA